ncbi:GxxExxY protein [Marinifilum fragile]|uniref:GxxExxY protein n=1 Tax=Marinifilum fragile TaxID=570161 RepID=UPI0006CFAB2D|nr:GxxExxY protein [Marinifilum fragile]
MQYLKETVVNKSREQIFRQILNCCFRIHTALGPGLLESAYEKCLHYELCKSGLKVERQKVLPLTYEKVEIESAYRIDLLVEDQIIIEIKATESFHDLHLAQTLTYMKLSGCKLGLLVNFNVSRMKHGIKRLIL